MPTAEQKRPFSFCQFKQDPAWPASLAPAPHPTESRLVWWAMLSCDSLAWLHQTAPSTSVPGGSWRVLAVSCHCRTPADVRVVRKQAPAVPWLGTAGPAWSSWTSPTGAPAGEGAGRGMSPCAMRAGEWQGEDASSHAPALQLPQGAPVGYGRAAPPTPHLKPALPKVVATPISRGHAPTASCTWWRAWGLLLTLHLGL